MSRSSSAGGRALALLLLGVVLLAGCGGGSNPTDPGGSGYFLRFKASGSQVEFTDEASLQGAFGQAGNQYNGLFTGYNASRNMSLQVFDGAAITQKSYSGFTNVGSALVGALLTWQDAGGIVYSSGGVTPDAVVTVTELTQTAVRGTFHGTVKATGHPDVAITAGEFYLHRAN